MSRIVPVPVGDRPAWELEDQSMNVERAPWRSVADSLVILQSLKQSRDRWLSSAFPKLPKQRGSKQAGSNIPIHEYKAHDKFELSVGPHIFPDTSLFEVIYTHTDGRNAIAQTMGYVTPETERLVIAAAADNPDLAQLLEQARRHKPSEADTKKLAEIIHVHVPGAFANAPSTQAPPRPRAWDLIIEFKEKSLDRRIFPRGSMQLERVHETPWGKLFDAMVITTLPYSQQQIGVDLQLSGQQDTLATPNDVSSPQPVTFHWRGLTQRTFELLKRWSSTSHPLDPATCNELSSRVYLPHQLPDGELFDIVHAAVAPPHAMKPIRPANADSGRTKRRNTRRKSTVEKPANAPVIPVSPAIQPPPSMGGQFSTFSVAQMAPQQVSANTPPAFAAGAHPIDHISHTESSAPVPPASAGAYSPAPTFSAPATVYASISAPATVHSPPAAPSYISTTPVPQPATFLPSSVPTFQATLGTPLTIPQSSQPRIQQTEPPPKRKKSRYEQPPPTCNSCLKSNVQLMHGGGYCRACIEAKRFPIPEVSVPSRTHGSSSTGTSHQTGWQGQPSSGADSPIVPGTHFSHWTRPSG